jgi:hypothetical protein
VAVGVDDARYDELAFEIYDAGAGRDRELRRRPHVANAAVLHHDGDVFLRACACAVNDGGMGENDHLCCRASGEQQCRRQNNKNACSLHIDSSFDTQADGMIYDGAGAGGRH